MSKRLQVFEINKKPSRATESKNHIVVYLMHHFAGNQTELPYWPSHVWSTLSRSGVASAICLWTLWRLLRAPCGCMVDMVKQKNRQNKWIGRFGVALRPPVQIAKSLNPLCHMVWPSTGCHKQICGYPSYLHRHISFVSLLWPLALKQWPVLSKPPCTWTRHKAYFHVQQTSSGMQPLKTMMSVEFWIPG